MPMYDYKCSGCGHADSEFMPMKDCNEESAVMECPGCGDRSYKRQVSLPHTDMKEFHTPIDLFSITMEDEAEIRAFKEKCPDVDCSIDPNDEMFGVPVARNRKQKLAALSAAGYVERN